MDHEKIKPNYCCWHTSRICRFLKKNSESTFRRVFFFKSFEQCVVWIHGTDPTSLLFRQRREELSGNFWEFIFLVCVCVPVCVGSLTIILIIRLTGYLRVTSTCSIWSLSSISNHMVRYLEYFVEIVRKSALFTKMVL